MKRGAILTVIVLICAAAGLLVSRPGKTEEQELGEAELSASLTLFPSALCRFTAALDAKDRTTVRNEYWDSVHATSHAVAALLGDKDKSQQARLMEAHGALEQDLSTLSPSLFAHGDTYVSEVRSAMKTLEIRGADRTCDA